MNTSQRECVPNPPAPWYLWRSRRLRANQARMQHRPSSKRNFSSVISAATADSWQVTSAGSTFTMALGTGEECRFVSEDVRNAHDHGENQERQRCLTPSLHRLSDVVPVLAGRSTEELSSLATSKRAVRTDSSPTSSSLTAGQQIGQAVVVPKAVGSDGTRGPVRSYVSLPDRSDHGGLVEVNQCRIPSSVRRKLPLYRAASPCS